MFSDQISWLFKFIDKYSLHYMGLVHALICLGWGFFGYILYVTEQMNRIVQELMSRKFLLFLE